MSRRPSAFIDCDGVNEDHGCVYRAEDLHGLPGGLAPAGNALLHTP